MKITNRYGLPGAFVEAVKNDTYTGHKTRHDISATRLIAPPQQVELTRRHWDQIEEDASQRVWSLLGQAAHTILERSEPSAIVEQRLFGEFAGWVVSGQYDRLTLRKTTLQDYKVASVWEAMNGLKPDREQQLNILAELAIRNGYEIRRLEIVHILRDWSRGQARQGGNYPPLPVKRIPVRLWSDSDRVAFIEQRVRAHQSARDADLDALPSCTPEDRWETPTKYAVMREGRKSAIRLCDTREGAEQVAEAEQAKKSGVYVQVRPGEAKRCVMYCPVAEFCPQRNREIRNQEAA